MSRRALEATVTTILALLDVSKCGAVLIITDGTRGLVDVQITSNLRREDQRKLAQHLIDLIDGAVIP